MYDLMYSYFFYYIQRLSHMHSFDYHVLYIADILVWHLKEVFFFFPFFMK